MEINLLFKNIFFLYFLYFEEERNYVLNYLDTQQ